MMDNCLASGSDTGGVGCDNMTMTIVGLLKGKTKEEWYQEIADRVANADGPCAPPEYAERRGPMGTSLYRGEHDSAEDYDDDMGMDQRTRDLPGRVILLGDGSHGNNEWADSDMFDNEDEDKDLESQVTKKSDDEEADDAEKAQRAQREETPAPISQSPTDGTAESESPTSTKTEHTDTGADVNEKSSDSDEASEPVYIASHKASA
jgi:protein phosphatase 2C family protein 2/3